MAADRGHAGAMNNLGVCYKEGTGVELDFDKAFSLFVEASKGHDQYSYINLARAYTFGQGTDIDLVVAKQWCQKAINENVKGADKFMKEIEEKMKKQKKRSLSSLKKK